MKAALLLLLSVSAFAADLPSGGNLKITPEMLKFKYIRFDGSRYVTCEHRIEDAAAQEPNHCAAGGR